MSVPAHLKDANLSAQKARLVINEIRGLPLKKALNFLEFSPKKAAYLVKKLLKSAVANAENNFNLDVDDLYVTKAYVNEAATYKRFRARAKGRGNKILKRNCHISLELGVAG